MELQVLGVQVALASHLSQAPPLDLSVPLGQDSPHCPFPLLVQEGQGDLQIQVVPGSPCKVGVMQFIKLVGEILPGSLKVPQAQVGLGVQWDQELVWV